MARREAVEKNELKINDNLSGSIVKIYFRMPTPSERQGYNNMAVQRQGRKVQFKQSDARLKYGMTILTGIGDGDFERKVDNKHVPISSDPASEHYFEEWKPWMQEHAGDLVMLMAAHVFDSPAEISEAEDLQGN